MNDNKIVDGKLISSQIREKIKYFGNKLIEKTGKKPGLAVVLVGENPASKVYVKNKIEKTIKYHQLIMGLPHSKRVLINDFSETNKFPTAEAINIYRNSKDLGKLL